MSHFRGAFVVVVARLGFSFFRGDRLQSEAVAPVR